MPLHVNIIRQELLADDQRESMLRLYRRYFCGRNETAFYADLRDKSWVILLNRPDGELAGFSTLQVLDLGTPAGIFLFSGDTIVDRAHWQSPALAGAFGHFMQYLIQQHPGRRCFWFLISKGFRTYRFLPVFFRQFYPVYDGGTSPDYPALLSQIARYKFGTAFDEDRGLIHPAGGPDRLRPEYSSVPHHRLADPHVKFFLERNPSFHEGTELACLAEIALGNLNHYARRVIRSTTVTWTQP